MENLSVLSNTYYLYLLFLSGDDIMASMGNCFICTGAIVNPSVTPCDHTYCRICIKQWALETRRMNAAGIPTCKCPICNEEFSFFWLTPTSLKIFWLYPPGEGPPRQKKKRRRPSQRRKRLLRIAKKFDRQKAACAKHKYCLNFYFEVMRF